MTPHDRPSVPPGTSIQRQRRSALELYAEFGPPPAEAWPKIHELMRDEDPRISATACKISLAGGRDPVKIAALKRLIDLLPIADWLLGEEIEDCLYLHFDMAHELIADVARVREGDTNFESPGARTVRALRRVAARPARSRSR